MRASHTRVSRLAVVATVGLVLAQLAVLLTAHAGYVVVVVGAVMLVTTLAAAKLYCHHCSESRIATMVVASASAAGVIMSATIGAPGGSPNAPDAQALALLGIAIVTLLLTSIDGLRGQPVVHPRNSPYAS